MMRQKNKRLGYGDDAKNWELKKYENERRNLKKLERLQKLYGVGEKKVAQLKKSSILVKEMWFKNQKSLQVT